MPIGPSSRVFTDPNLVPMHDPGFNAARNCYRGVFVKTKFGFTQDIDTTSTPEDIWAPGGIYTGFPNNDGEVTEIYSTSDEDGAGGLTGMLSCVVEYLATPTSTVYTTEEVTLTGTTPVILNGGNPIWRANRAYGTSAGSNQSNVGQIICRHTVTTANVFLQLPVGYGQTHVCQWTVPYENTFFVEDIGIQLTSASGSTTSALVEFATKNYDENCWRSRIIYECHVGDVMDHMSFPVVVKGGTDIRTRVISVGANNTAVSAQFSGLYGLDQVIGAEIGS